MRTGSSGELVAGFRTFRAALKSQTSLLWGQPANIFSIGLKSPEAVDFVLAMSRKVQRSEVCADCSAPGKAEIYGLRRCCELWLSGTRSSAAASGRTAIPHMRRDTRLSASGKWPNFKGDTAAQQICSF